MRLLIMSRKKQIINPVMIRVSRSTRDELSKIKEEFAEKEKYITYNSIIKLGIYLYRKRNSAE